MKVLFAAVLMGATGQEVLKPACDPHKHEFFTHKSGLKAFVTEDPQTKKCSATLQVDVGYLMDPVEFPGVAHFVEHVAFMGSKKYPAMDLFNTITSQNGGSTNAFTDTDITTYYFDISCEKFDEAFDIFAHFFIDPLFREESAKSELSAVDSEHKKNVKVDMWRREQLLQSLSNPQSLYVKFGTGNSSTLDKPGIAGVLMKFFKEHYVPSRFTLSVYGKDNEKLKKLIGESFAELQPDGKPPVDYGPNPFFTSKELGKLVKMKAIESQSLMRFVFVFNSKVSNLPTNPLKILEKLIDNPEPGSFYNEIHTKAWGTSISHSTFVVGNSFTQYIVQIKLTQEGVKHFEELQKMFFEYIAGVTQGFEQYVYEDIKNRLEIDFQYNSKTDPTTLTQIIVSNSQHYSPENVLVGPYSLGKYSLKELKSVFEKIVPSNSIVIICSEEFSNLPLTEPIYGTSYSVEQNKVIVNLNPRAPPRLPSKAVFRPSAAKLAQMVEKPLPSAQSSRPRVRNLTPRNYRDKGRLYYYKDKVFGLPLFICTFKIYLDSARLKGAFSSAALNIFEALVKKELQTLQYQLHLVNADVSFTQTKSGFDLSFEGVVVSFAHTKAKVIDFIDNVLLGSFPQNEFEKQRVKKLQETADLRRSYLYRYGMFAWRWVAFKGENSAEQLEDALADITYEQFKDYSGIISSGVFVEALVTGNLFEDEAIDVFGRIIDAFPCSETENFKTKERLLFDMDTSAAVLLPNPQEDSDNSFVGLWFYLGDTQEDRAFVEILESAISSAFFDQLRTRKQLGYAVFTRIIETQGHSLMSFIVQSDKQTSAYCLAEIHTFLREKLTEIESWTAGNYTLYREGAKASYLQPFSSFVHEHKYLEQQMSTKPKRFWEKWNMIKAIDSFDLNVFKIKFKRDFVEQPKKFSLHMSSTKKYQKTYDELQETRGKNEKDLFISIQEFQKRRATYPDLWRLDIEDF